MKGVGIALVVLGFVGLIAGMVMDTSVTSGLSRIENIGLLSRQQSVLTVSALAFLAGCVLIGFAAVCDAIQRLGPAISAHLPRQPSSPSGRPVTPLAPAGGAAASDDGTKTCQKCYAMAKADAERCPRCGAAFASQGAVDVGARVRSRGFGEGVVLSVDSDTARVKFETIDQPTTINIAALMVIERAK